MKEQTRGKRLLSILLCFVMMLSLVPMTAFAAGGDTAYDVWLGETQVTSANKDDILEDGTASYNPTTQTLTLDGYDGDYIKAEHALTIHVASDSAITTQTSGIIDGIKTEGTCTITGSGDLTIDALSHTFSIGINANNYVDAKIYITGSGDLTINAAADGVWADSSIEISGSGNVTVTAGGRAFRSYSDRLILSGSGTVTATSTADNVVTGSYVGGPAVELKGTHPSVSFKTTAAGKKAVTNDKSDGTDGMLVGGTNFDNYTATGAPNEKSVVYTRKSSTPSPTAITNIAVTIDAPAIGATPDYDPAFTTTPSDALTFYDMDWWKIAKADYTGSADDDWDQMSSDIETFEAGYYYSADMYFMAKDGYEVVSATTATINGQSHNNTFGDVNETTYADAYVCYIFDTLTSSTDVENYDIWLGETQVTSANQDNILGDEGTATASYDPDTKTLTLNGYNGDYILAEQALNIKLEDDTDNFINVPEVVLKNGIYTEGRCTLTGNGNLKINVQSEDRCGIRADNMANEDGELTKVGDIIIDMNGNLVISTKYDGIDAWGVLTIKGNGSLTVTAPVDGLYAENGIKIENSGDITINGSIDSDEASGAG